ncbi:MAG: hypothetical protein M0R80_08860 [Proteobacteria bacterium]|jgi:hypothetical protein|nr:hypothetical protein [Pseudomonadota bacterium]
MEFKFRLWLEEEEEDPDRYLSSDEVRRKYRKPDKPLEPITLNSRIDTLWLPKSYDYSASEVIAQLGWWNKPLGEIIKTPYEALKKAMWDVTATRFGYIPSLYRTHAPDEFHKMGDAEKRIFISDRSMGGLHNAIFELHWCKQRTITDDYSYKQIERPPLPEPVIKWLDYLNDELEHDEEHLQHMHRFDADIKAQSERWAMQKKKQEDDAQKLSKALFKARNNLSGWEDATEQEALTTAREYMKAAPHERGQFQRSIQDIARKVLNKRLPTKSFYMDDKEAKQYLQQVVNTNLVAATDQEISDILNKTIGITDSQDLQGNDWGENVHPALSAGDLNTASGLRIKSGEEISNRIKDAWSKKNEKQMRHIYYALDKENRKLFFKQ